VIGIPIGHSESPRTSLPPSPSSPRGAGLLVVPARARSLLLGVCVAFVLLVGLHLHGFSLAAWHSELDGSAPAEVLLGNARKERWDDWVVHLPLALAQVAHKPRFPVINENIGIGMNMLVPISIPVWHPVALFRPMTWGFFLGRDFGISWMWWTRVLGLLSVWFLVFLILTRGRVGLSLAAALLLLLSPFLQFWSFNAAPFAIYAGLTWLAAICLATATRPRAILASGIALGWSGACLALETYPPYQLILGYLVLVLLVGFLWENRGALEIRRNGGSRILALSIAILIAGAAVAWLWSGARDAIGQLQNTVYPGRRLSTGGDKPLWQLFNANLWIPLQVSNYGSLGRYTSSAASFWLVSPLIAAALLVRRLASREPVPPLLVGLAIYCGVILVDCEIGLPTWFLRASLLGLVPSERALLGLGFADAALLVCFLATSPPLRTADRYADAAIALAWSAWIAFCARSLASALPEARPVWLVLLVAANGVVAFAILRRVSPTALVAALAGGLAACTLWFNPLAVGGSSYLLENPLSRVILEIDRLAGGKTVWSTYGDDRVANLFRVLGVHSLNGVHPIPELALWRRIDPLGVDELHYNRFAHVWVGEARTGTRFGHLQDVLALYADPEEGVLEQLGVTHLLARMDSSAGRRLQPYKPIARVGPFGIFELPLHRRR